MIDDDGQAYMYFGCREPKVVKLKENMIELAGPVESVTIKGIEGDTTDNGGWYGEGPFTFVGEVMTPNKSGTSHGSVVDYNDTWYLFYHTNKLSGHHLQRSITFDEIKFNDSGKIIPPK